MSFGRFFGYLGLSSLLWSIIITALGVIALGVGLKVYSRSNELTDEQSDDDED